MSSSLGGLLIAAAVLCSDKVSADPGRRTVAVDFSQLDEPTYRRLNGAELERRAVMRLVEEGFAVVSRSENPEVLLQAVPAVEGLGLQARIRGDTLLREVRLTEAPLVELQLEITQKLADLARQSVPVPGESPMSVGPAPLLSSAPLRRSTSFELSTGAGVLLRGAVDPTVAVDLRRGAESGFGQYLSARFVPSSGAGISVREFSVLGGVGWQWALTDNLWIDAAAEAGFGLQFFALADESVSAPRGTLASFNVAVPVRLRRRLSDRLVVSLRISPGLATASYEHTVDGQSVWRRSALSFEMCGSLGYLF
jgi:hypothetical protein